MIRGYELRPLNGETNTIDCSIFILKNKKNLPYRLLCITVLVFLLTYWQSFQVKIDRHIRNLSEWLFVRSLHDSRGKRVFSGKLDCYSISQKNINLHASKSLLKKLLSKVKPTFSKETLKQFIKIVVVWEVLFRPITVLVTLIDRKMIARLDDIILKHMFKIRRVVGHRQEVADTQFRTKRWNAKRF